MWIGRFPLRPHTPHVTWAGVRALARWLARAIASQRSRIAPFLAATVGRTRRDAHSIERELEIFIEIDDR